jgi:ADP-ribose pyrophosphatase YjhB (NUDIX family)
MKQGEDFIGTCVIFFCHDGKNNYLLNKRSTACRDEHGTWDPGGGAIEFGDSVDGTIRKEIKEEYCADVIEYEFLGFRDVHRVNEGKKTHWIALDFKVLIDPSQAKIGEPHKSDGIGWYTLDAMPSPLHSQFPYFLKKYEGRI